MASYSWGEQAPLQEVTITPYGKSFEAVITPAANMDIRQLAALRTTLRSAGLRTLDQKKDDAEPIPILRVRGLKDEQSFISTLESNGFANAASRTAKAGPPAPKRSLKQWFISRIMVIDGALTLAGDVFLWIAGRRHSDKEGGGSGQFEKIASALYGAQSIALITLGHTSADKVYEKAENDLLQYLDKQHVTILPIGEVQAKDLGKTRNPLRLAANFFRAHPTQILNATASMAGVNMFLAGHHQNRDNLAAKAAKEAGQPYNAEKLIEGGKTKAAAGAMIGSGMALALVIPEKNMAWLEEDKQKNPGTLHDVKRKVVERPQRIASWLAVGNNLAQIVSAIQERNGYRVTLLAHENGQDVPEAALKAAQYKESDWLYTLGSSVFYLSANGLLTWASKTGHMEKAVGSSELKYDLCSKAAEVIAEAEPERQDELIAKTSKELSGYAHMDDSAENLATTIREEIERQKNSPWCERVAKEETEKRMAARA